MAASSDIRTPKDLLARLKADPGSLRIGNAAFLDEDYKDLRVILNELGLAK